MIKKLVQTILLLTCISANASSCQENMVLKFKDGNYTCLDSTIFVNLKATLGGPFSIEKIIKPLYSGSLIGKNLVLAVTKNIKECSAS
jgi:hypothetical protein